MATLDDLLAQGEAPTGWDPDGDESFCSYHSAAQMENPKYYNQPSPPGAAEQVDEVSLTYLQPGLEHNHTLCLRHWGFVRLQTRPNNFATGGAAAAERHTLVMTLDTDYKAATGVVEVARFTTVDAYVYEPPATGSQAPPASWFRVRSINFPGDAWDMSRMRRFEQRDSFTLTLGANATLPECQRRLPDYLYVLVRCGNPDASAGSWSNFDEPCRFTLRYELLPTILADGSAVGPAAIEPGASHFYRVMVGEYDVMRFRFRREGKNLTLYDGCGNGCSDPARDTTRGHGLLGTLTFARDECPTAGATPRIALDNSSEYATQEWFCTGAGDGGWYYLGLHAASLFDPYGPAPGYALPGLDSEDYQYDPLSPGARYDRNPREAGAGLAVNPQPLQEGANPNDPNQVREARGHYSVRVDHLTFEAGAVARGEQRYGCVGYAQWRRFSLIGDGPSRAALRATVRKVSETTARHRGARGGLPLSDDVPVSSLYARLNKPPTAQIYDSVLRPPQRELTASACDLDTLREWHMGVALDGQLRATASNLFAGYFVLQADLESQELTPPPSPLDVPNYKNLSRAERAAAAQQIQVVTPKARGGLGYVCCGQIRQFRVRNVPNILEVNVEINVSAGRAHALYIKQEGCASFTAEEDYGCNVGDGKGCAVRWLVHYDLFTGVGYWNTSGTLAAPFSTGNIEDTSDWMVGVQAHGVQPVEFSLWLSAQEREAPYIEQTCGRLDHFCPGEQRLVNRTISVFGTGEDLESAAPRAAAGGGGAALLLVLGAVLFGRRVR